LGGTIHMMMRHYTFLEDQLCLGVPETEETVSHTHGNFKLWYCITASDLRAISG
ncbi:hypothetical protein K438DRAFT_1639494, partial [Mycena galopus ATCC 62051]